MKKDNRRIDTIKDSSLKNYMTFKNIHIRTAHRLPINFKQMGKICLKFSYRYMYKKYLVAGKSLFREFIHLSKAKIKNRTIVLKEGNFHRRFRVGNIHELKVLDIGIKRQSFYRKNRLSKISRRI